MFYVLLAVAYTRDISTGWAGCGEGTDDSEVYSGGFYLTVALQSQREICPGLYRAVLQVLSVLAAF